MPSVLLDTEDIGAAEATLSAIFSKMRIRARPQATTAPVRLARCFMGAIGVGTVEYGCDVEYAMEPPAQILLCRVFSGGITQRSAEGATERYRPGDVVVFGPREAPPFEGHLQRGRYDLLVIDPRCLSDIAGNAVHLTGTSAISSPANRQLSTLIEYVHRTAANWQSQDNPLLAGMLEQHIAAVLLANLPNDTVLEPTSQNRHADTPAVLQRAIAYIEENARADISLADIAAAVYVTPRALQYMFRKHRDCTPMTYLRRVRLHRAHLDLLAADETTTVGEVARRWGFAHAGRFAAYHREHYGATPQQLLRGIGRTGSGRDSVHDRRAEGGEIVG